MHDASKKLKILTMLAVLIIIVGLVLMIGKIIADSEPGLIPIMLILVGSTWYFILRRRRQSQRS